MVQKGYNRSPEGWPYPNGTGEHGMPDWLKHQAKPGNSICQSRLRGEAGWREIQQRAKPHRAPELTLAKDHIALMALEAAGTLRTALITSARAVETKEANAFVRRPRNGIPYLTPRFRGGR